MTWPIYGLYVGVFRTDYCIASARDSYASMVFQNRRLSVLYVILAAFSALSDEYGNHEIAPMPERQVEETLKNMGKQTMWICWKPQHNDNKTKHV